MAKIFHIKKLGGLIKTTLKTDRDVVAPISGGTGEGKSTLAIQLAFRIKPNFNLDNVIFSRQEFIDKVNNSKKGDVLIIDEGSNIAFKRDFMHKEQKDIMKLFDMCRDKNLCILINVPHFWSLDNHLLRSGKIKLWFHIIKRGIAHIFKPDNNPMSFDPWHQKYNEKAETRKRIKYHQSNYIGKMRFKRLPEEVEQKYRELKEEKRKKYLEQEQILKEQKEVIPQEHQHILLLDKGNKHTRQEIADIVGVTPRTVYRVLAKYDKDTLKSEDKSFINTKGVMGVEKVKVSKYTYI